ncbi:hypothetical protein BDY19DRAFT_931938, partial [Irpex rosettiformis]
MPPSWNQYNSQHTSHNTTGPNQSSREFRYGENRSPPRCMCEKCIPSSVKFQALSARLDKCITIKNFRNILFTIFATRLLYNVFSHPTPGDMVGGLISDASHAASDAFSFMIIGPFSLGRWFFVWFFRQAMLLFKDCLASLSFLLILLRIALRLAGAYVLYLIWPIIAMIFVVYPLGKFLQLLEPKQGRKDENVLFDDLLEQALREAFRKQMAEARAEEEERCRKGEKGNAARGRGKRRRGGK